MDGLVTRFGAALSPERQAELEQRAEAIGAMLSTLCDQAIAVHPELGVSRGDLAAALAARLPDDVDIELGLTRLHVADILLAVACAGGDSAAIDAFQPMLEATVNAAARSVRAPADIGDEVTQRLREVLLVGDAKKGPRITNYAGRGDLGGFLRISAVRECLRQLRRRKRDVGSSDDVFELLAPETDPVLEQLKAAYSPHFNDCFAGAVARLEPRERSVLRYQVIERLSIDEIGTVYGVHRSTAARWLERARTHIAELTEEMLADRLSLDINDVASVIRLVRSQLDVTLERLLSDDEA